MEFTGERFLPEIAGGIALEHRHRYLLAARYAQGKDVLDIASGEGYGSALMAGAANSVVGVDISHEAVAHAQSKYAAHNLRYMQGSADAIPLPDASVDLVVSFETIEHHDAHEEMLQEIKRVLRPNGILCISSPDHYEYSIVPGYQNEYHVKELTLEEFSSLLGRYFANQKMTGQRIAYGSLIAGQEDGANFAAWHVESPVISPATGLPHAVYLIALASDGELPDFFSSLMEDSVENSDPYKELFHLNTEKENELSYIKKETQEIRNEKQRTKARIHELEESLRESEESLRVVYASRSWRITRPLRILGSLARKIKQSVCHCAGNTPDSEAIQAGNEAAAPKHGTNFVEECVCAYKAGRLLPVADIMDIRIHVAAEGNLFFLEIAQLIQGGFSDMGKQTAIVVSESFSDCADASHADADLHLVVAPHEFFHFIPQAEKWPHAKGLLWVLNAEQAHTSWFAAAKKSFNKADLILDMDQELALHLARQGFRAEHLPLGFSPSCRIFDGIAPISLNDATAGIPHRIRDWAAPENPLDASLHERPLDYCFFGTSTERRAAFFARNAATFAKLEGYLRLKPLTGPLRVGENSQLSTECTSSIIRRSKVSLNIHQSEHSYFEWHRIVLQGMRQGALVLSEPCTAALPFRPNIDYVSVNLDHIADTLEYLLLSDAGKAFAERVRRQAYTTLTEHCRLGNRLRELLELYPCAAASRGCR